MRTAWGQAATTVTVDRPMAIRSLGTMLRHVALAAVSIFAAAMGCTSIAGIDDFEVIPGGGTAGGQAGSGGGPSGGQGGQPAGGQGGQPAGGQGGAAGAGGSGGCSSPTECPGVDTTCRYRTCDGSCGMQNAPQGTVCTENGGEVCDGDGNCVFDLGHSCSSGTECASDICQDLVCCDSACAGPCESCLAADTGGADGTCAAVEALTDPASECTAPPALGCDGSDACATCGATATPAGGTCPPACDLCENNDTCVILADVDDEYFQGAITCPPGWHCDIRCTAADACRETAITCAERFSCQVSCADSNHKCEDAVIACPANAPCSIDCGGGDTCRNAALNCGANDCAATCSGGDFPSLNNCAGPCACTVCS